MGRIKIVKKPYRSPRMFDAEYILTMGLDPRTRIPFVIYQLLPAYIDGHHVNIIKRNGVIDMFVCTRCKIMGNRQTLKDYHCD